MTRDKVIAALDDAMADQARNLFETFHRNRFVGGVTDRKFALKNGLDALAEDDAEARKMIDAAFPE